MSVETGAGRRRGVRTVRKALGCGRRAEPRASPARQTPFHQEDIRASKHDSLSVPEHRADDGSRRGGSAARSADRLASKVVSEWRPGPAGRTRRSCRASVRGTDPARPPAARTTRRTRAETKLLTSRPCSMKSSRTRDRAAPSPPRCAPSTAPGTGHAPIPSCRSVL
jgi:hypothetical protein